MADENRKILRKRVSIKDLKTLQEVKDDRDDYMAKKGRRDAAEATKIEELEKLEDEFNQAKETQLPPSPSTAAETGSTIVQEGQTQGEVIVPPNIPSSPPEQVASNTQGVLEEEDRQSRTTNPASSNSNPFSKGNLNTVEKSFNDTLREGNELQMMKKENNPSTGLTEEKKKLEGMKNELASSQQATQEKPQGSVSSEPQSETLAGTEEMFSTSSSTESSTESSGLPFYMPESTASAESQTP